MTELDDKQKTMRSGCRFIALAKDGAVVAEYVWRTKEGYMQMLDLVDPTPFKTRRGHEGTTWKMQCQPLALPDGARVYRYHSKARERAMKP